ncbi:25852_t:CDS:2, partial [Dentiscutata erythropus]
GKSNWLEGALLIATFAIMALAFFFILISDEILTVGNIKQFEKIVETYPQNTVGIIVTLSQKRSSFNSSKRAKSTKSSASILFTSVNEMATDIPAYFLLKDYQFDYQHKLIENFENFEKRIIIMLIFLLLMMGYSAR